MKTQITPSPRVLAGTNGTVDGLNALVKSLNCNQASPAMQSLKERIAVCKSMAAEIIATYPGVTNVQFQLDGCDINEIKGFDSDPRVAGDRLRGLVNSFNGNCTIFADTPPFKSVKPLEYEF